MKLKMADSGGGGSGGGQTDFRKIRNVMMRGIDNGRVACPLLELINKEALVFMP